MSTGVEFACYVGTFWFYLYVAWLTWTPSGRAHALRNVLSQTPVAAPSGVGGIPTRRLRAAHRAVGVPAGVFGWLRFPPAGTHSKPAHKRRPGPRQAARTFNH